MPSFFEFDPVSVEEEHVASEPKGTLSLQVLGPSGDPVPGAYVVGDGIDVRADEQGRMELPGLDPGVKVLKVFGAGASFTYAAIVKAGETTQAVLRGTVGGRLALRVQDEEGRALPFARVRIEQPSGLAHADVEDGVQRVDSFVGGNGRRLFRCVEAGSVKVHVEYAGTSAVFNVSIHEGARAELVAVLGLDRERASTRVGTAAPSAGAKERMDALVRKLGEARKVLEEARRREKDDR